MYGWMNIYTYMVLVRDNLTRFPETLLTDLPGADFPKDASSRCTVDLGFAFLKCDLESFPSKPDKAEESVNK